MTTILSDHHRAELQRLEQGQAGCGCSDCQALYKTLDLSKFGSRVFQLDGHISIGEGKNKIPSDCWTDDGAIFVHYGKRWGLTKEGQRICRGPVEVPKTTEDTDQNATDSPLQSLGGVAKIPPSEISPPNDTLNTNGGIMQQEKRARGRPPKPPEELVHRTTGWRRRRKKELQGVLL